ncbi:MAG: DNA internalization-related competence protein ComEC/Rec2 [Gammaproteobacteria bacterium]
MVALPRRGRWPALVALAVAWLAGATLALAGHHLVAIPVLLGAAGGALLLTLWDRRAAFLLVAVLGALWTTYAAERAMARRLPFALEKKTLTLTGTVANLPRAGSGRIRFRLKVDKAVDTDGREVAHPNLVALSWYRPPDGTTVRTGERWRFAVRLKRPRSLADPGVFDYAGWALAHGIGASGYIYHDRATRIAPAGPGLNALRAGIARAISRALPASPYAGLVAGLAVGDQGAVSEAQWQTLRATGTTHLLAISGLHLGMVAALAFFVFLALARRVPILVRRVPARVVAVGAAALAALAYGALAGFSLSTERALVMLSLPLLVVAARRRIRVADALALAAIVVLLVSPLALITASFWLSFGAVAALIYGLSSRHPGWGLIRAQIVVSLGLAPLIAAFFGQVSLIGPIANLIAIPVVSWLVVPPALLGVAAQMLHAGWGAPLFQCSAFILSWLWPALDWLAALPHAVLTLGAASGLAVVAAVAGAALLLSPRGLGLRVAGLALFLPLVLPGISRPAPGDYRVTVLDVGQGLAAVVTTAHHTLLVDTGPKWWGGNNAGREIVIPFLRSRRLRPDRLLLSHGDSDHSGGLGAIEKVWPDLPILTSVPGEGEPCVAGQHWRWDGVRFAILSPPSHATGSDNNRSCVLKVSGPGGSALFPGDIEASRERWLLAQKPVALAAGLLVAPHHGSASSSTPGFVATVDPRFVVFAAGYLNQWHFPRPEVTARYRREGAQLLGSAHGGALTFVISRRSGLRLVSRYRPEHGRPWTDP